VFWTLTDKQK